MANKYKVWIETFFSLHISSYFKKIVYLFNVYLYVYVVIAHVYVNNYKINILSINSVIPFIFIRFVYFPILGRRMLYTTNPIFKGFCEGYFLLNLKKKWKF